MTTTSVDVFVEDHGALLEAGRAYFTRNRGTVSTTFLYEPDYLAAGGRNIDPILSRTVGAQHVPGMLPAFSDCAPDRWGRNLLVKAERGAALDQGRRPRDLDDVDYLLGVSDEARQGALRFRLTGQEQFASPYGTVPRMISLPRLLDVTRSLIADDDPFAAAKALLETGTAGLGGARPKASVLLRDGSLALAKFPHASDEWDVMAWEATALDLYALAGIDVPDHQLVSIGGNSVLIMRRFDRAQETGHRLAYISALTALSLRDGDAADYVDLAQAMRDLSEDLERDQRDLYRRVVASAALGNTDDHLRNHGFLAHGLRWRLSPAFDINPNPDIAKSRSTSIAGATTIDNEAQGLLALAPACGLALSEARDTIADIVASMSAWRQQGAHNGLSSSHIRLMEQSIQPRLNAISTAATTRVFPAGTGDTSLRPAREHGATERSFCGALVASTHRPCILAAGHRGKHRSR